VTLLLLSRYGVWTNGGDPLSELANWLNPLCDSRSLCSEWRMLHGNHGDFDGNLALSGY
jgi:hypothetical protein